MGNAYTAVADDEQAVFMNPAGLAGIERMAIHFAVLDAEISGDTYSTASESISTFKEFNSSSISSLIGKNIYARGQFTPTIVMPNFGMALLMDQQYALLSQNKALPQVTLGYQTTIGVQFSTGFSVLKKRGKNPEQDLRVGVGFKWLERRGGYRSLSLIQTITLDKQAAEALIGGYGSGYGADLGLQYIRKLGRNGLTLQGGAVMTEIGDVTFAGSNADPQKGNFSLGAALKYEKAFFRSILSYDARHLLQSSDWKKKNHLGLELALPLLSFYGGINQSSLSYGAAVDLWLIKVAVISYAEERGEYAGIDSERRYLLHLGFKLGF